MLLSWRRWRCSSLPFSLLNVRKIGWNFHDNFPNHPYIGLWRVLRCWCRHLSFRHQVNGGRSPAVTIKNMTKVCNMVLVSTWKQEKSWNHDTIFKFYGMNLLANTWPKTPLVLVRLLKHSQKGHFWGAWKGWRAERGRVGWLVGAGPFVTLFCRQIRLGGEGATCDFHRLFSHTHNICSQYSIHNILLTISHQ